MPGVQTRHNDIDMVLIRENTEGEYTNLEHEVGESLGTDNGKQPYIKELFQ